MTDTNNQWRQDNMDEIVYASMCLWESVLDWNGTANQKLLGELSSDDLGLLAWFEREGYCGCRLLVQDWGEYLFKAWQLAEALDWDDSMDWEFCPRFLLFCIEWGKTGEPILRTDWEAQVCVLVDKWKVWRDA